MPTIIKKGTNPSAFRLASGKNVVLRVGAGGGDFLNILSDSDYEMLMKEYGNFITPRIISDKNPRGCFIISETIAKAQDMGKEIGSEIKDNSAPIEVETKKKSKKGRR
jgi:hypothetical protein